MFDFPSSLNDNKNSTLELYILYTFCLFFPFRDIFKWFYITSLERKSTVTSHMNCNNHLNLAKIKKKKFFLLYHYIGEPPLKKPEYKNIQRGGHHCK